MSPAQRPNFGTMQLAIFRGEDPGGVLWQPRLDWWYKVNKTRGTLPDHLKDATMLDIYDYCYASCRYFIWDRTWWSEHSWLRSHFKNTEMLIDWEDDYRMRCTWHTPRGSLTQLIHFDEWKVSEHIVEQRIKKPEDLKTLQYLLEDEVWYWDHTQYQQDLEIYSAYGIPQFYYRRSPIQRLIIEEMGLEKSIYFMADHPDLLQEYLEFTTAADDQMYDVIVNCPVPIINLGENIEGSINSPTIWNNYLGPYYNKRITQLHSAGKFVSIHMDGKLKSLLPYLQACKYDAIEAPTPLPQGDITLEQLKSAAGDLIIMDGIPGLYFIEDQCSIDTLMEFVRKLVDMFHPRLVLGVSDEFPPDGDIERARIIGELVKEMGK